MSFDFLQGYHIPTKAAADENTHLDPELRKIDEISSYSYGSLLEHSSPINKSNTGSSTTAYEENIQQTTDNLNRFLPPGKHGTNFQQKPSHGLKRKLETQANAEQTDGIHKLFADAKKLRFEWRDESYPEELKKLILPQSCGLCKTQMNSMNCAKAHYESKTHDRNVTAWLTNEYTNLGMNPPLVKRFVKESRTGTTTFHCDLCDLDLTSVTHASQHYAGRKHRLVANQISKPSGSGFYNPEGQWVRTSTKAEGTVSDDGRFGIGEKFRTKQTETVVETVIDTTPTTTAALQKPNLSCTVCQISVTSETQMAMHLAGAKHQKKLKGSIAGDEAAPVVTELETSVGNQSQLESPSKSNDVNARWAMFRTPSGQYYCQICKISLEHVSTLQQHLRGKKHLKKTLEEAKANEKSVH